MLFFYIPTLICLYYLHASIFNVCEIIQLVELIFLDSLEEGKRSEGSLGKAVLP